MDRKAMYKLSYGLFILTAKEAEKDNGCIINTAIQAASEPNQLSICVNKANYTHDMIQRTGKFTVSVLSQKAQFELFKHFGFQSGRDTNKFEAFEQCASPVQQAGRLFRVMAARFQRQVAIRHRGGQQAGSHGLGTVEDGGGDAFLVHRVLQGQAHIPLPGEGLMGVEQYGPRGDGLADGRRVAPLTTDGVEIVQIEHVAIGPEHQIHVPLVQGQQDGLMVGHHLPAHGLQAGLLAPVGGIGREQGVLVLLVFLQDPRARAHKAAHAVTRLPVDEAGRRDETEGAQQPQLDEGGIIGMLEYQTPGVAVHDFVTLDLVDHVQPGVA